MKFLIICILAFSLNAQEKRPDEKVTAGAITTSGSAKLQEEGMPIARELELEAQLLASQEKEATDKANALLKLVFEPINTRKQELLAKACASAKLADVNGRPGCEIRGGRIYPAPRQIPAGATISEASGK